MIENLTPFGFLPLDKPLRITSHDVVAAVRKSAKALGYKALKVGHAGTLDPLADGVLVLCVGGATRLSEFVMNTTKRYRARVHLGVETTTYDAEGEVVAHVSALHFTRADVEGALQPFIGAIAQIPPMYSAIKQDGKKLYELARAGETVERAPRAVTIYAIDIVAFEPPFVMLDVTCSAGTYIRSLAHDLGAALSVGGSLAALTRTASGHFAIENALPMSALEGDWRMSVIAPSVELFGGDWTAIHLDANSTERILRGQSVSPVLPENGADNGLVYDSAGALIAVARRVQRELGGDLWKPEKVFSP